MLSAIDLQQALASARLLALDFDGVLTPGELQIHSSGDFTKSVSYIDIVGITRWRRLGHGICIITGDSVSPIPQHFAKAFKVPRLLVGRMDKAEALGEVAAEFGVSMSQTLYMGDDVMDLPAMELAAVGATVPTAHPHVRMRADWESTFPAGCGAVRELVDLALGFQGYDVLDLRPHPR